MGDLRSAKLIYLKALLFGVIGVLSSAELLLDDPHWKTLGLLVVTVWAFARLYYFMFYVVEHYVDGGYRFAGVTSFLVYVLRKRKT